MTELTATYRIMQANATIGIYCPFTIKVGDIAIAISWGYNVLKIRLFDEYEEYNTTSLKDAKNVLRYALRHPRPRRDEYPTRMAS